MSRFDLFFVVVDECDEWADNAIARHIVGNHQNKDKVVVAEFPITQMQRYIRFTRTIKPQLTKEAAVVLREAYVRLRNNDLSYQKSSYRITVRQLESLIRLSEALARVHCSYEITADYVHEAARLLSNSILKVHKPDLEIEPYEDIAVVSKPQGQPDGTNVIREELQKQNTENAKKKVTLKSDEYEKIAKALIWSIRDSEKRNDSGMKQSDLIEWFISQNISIVNTMDEYNELTKVLRSIINRLLKTERILMISIDDADPLNRWLKLHPNYCEEL